MVPEDLLTAYSETEYRVFSVPPFTLRVGERSDALAVQYRTLGAASSAFISACNPYSAELTEDENRKRHAEFGCELQALQLQVVEGTGQHPSNGWPGEPSYLAFGLSLQTAREIGIRLQQNAILWMDADAIPQLVLLR